MQVVADRNAESAATFDHGKDRRYFRSRLLAAEVDPVLAAGGDEAFIVPLLLKCLKTLGVGFPYSPATGGVCGQ